MQMVRKQYVCYSNEYGVLWQGSFSDGLIVHRDVSLLKPRQNCYGAYFFERYEGQETFEGSVIGAQSSIFNIDIYRQLPNGTYEFVRHEAVLGSKWIDNAPSPRH